MKVLMLSTDSQIFNEGSVVRQRILDYGKLVEELHVVVYTKRNFQFSIFNFQKNSKIQISNNTWLYPTNTRFKLLYFWDAYKLGKSIIENLKFKIENCVVTAQDPFETGLVGALLAKIYKIPLQIQIHTDFLSPFYKRESLKNRLRVMVARRVIQRANGLRVVSERIKNSIINIFPKIKPDKISVISIAVDVLSIRQQEVRASLRTKYPGYDFIALMASRFTTEKNIPMAIMAWADVAKRYHKALLLLVGSGPEHQNLKLKIENLKLQNNVVIEPWADDLVSYYKTADVFLLTSNYEGGARSPAEALAVGLPVIMTDVAPANEFVVNGQNGFVVPVGDFKALADRINKLIGMNPTKRGLFSKQGIAMADHFRAKAEYLRDYRASLEITLDPIFKNSK